MTLRVPLIVVAFAVVLTAVVGACSADEAISERSTPIPSPIVQVAITPSPVTIIDTATPTPTATPTISENPWERCMGAANLVPLPESSSQNQSTPDPLELLHQSAVAMSELESFATTKVALETYDDRSEDYSRQSPQCSLTQTKYEHPDRAVTRRTTYEERGLSVVSQEQKLWIGESHYGRRYDHYLWTLRPAYWSGTISSRSFLPFVMLSLLKGEYPSQIEVKVRLVGTELLDGVAVYHVRREVTSPPIESGNIASLWIGVDDLLVRRAHWARAGTVNHHQPYLITFFSDLYEFHSFNEDFNIQLPPDDEIARP